MRTFSLLSLATLAIASATAAPLEKRADAGYLAATFNGQLEQVYFHVAPASSPQSFRTLNNGNPYLTATLGTQGARDPSILKTQDGSKLYVLATDLNIGRTNWGDAQTRGSRSIHIWESSDGVNWSSDRLAQLMPATAGYVWAPSAIWDPARSAYAVFWSSVTYASSDTGHTGASSGPFIWYSHTTDFRSFTTPARWNPNNSATVIDQEIISIGGSSYIRYLSDTNQVRRVVVERSDNGLFGTWKRIGVPVDAVREGPATVRDINNPNRYYLWEDDYSGPGYECYYTDNFTVPYQKCASNISPAGMRHGGVVSIDSSRYSALSSR